MGGGGGIGIRYGETDLGAKGVANVVPSIHIIAKVPRRDLKGSVIQLIGLTGCGGKISRLYS